MTDLLQDNCQHYPKGTPPLGAEYVTDLLGSVTGWVLVNNSKAISHTYKFHDYPETIRFVNSVAEIINEQDHHPEMLVTYNTCTLTFSTHTTGGLTKNDFICAAKINALIKK